MIFFKKIWQFFKNNKNYWTLPSPWDQIVILTLNILIMIPLLIIAHQNLIDLDWFWHLDRVLLAIVLIALVQWILSFIRKFIIIGIFLYLIVLLYGTLIGIYGFKDISQDYSYMLHAMANSPNPEEYLLPKVLPFPNKSKMLKAIEYNHPNIRNFAVFATQKHFSDIKGHQKHRKMIQYFAVFKEIRDRWNYVNDPKRDEYIALASESLIHFSGDCDDHAVLMAACIRAIGGTPRLVHTKNHIYPEVLIGDKSDLEAANFLIRELLFVNEVKNKGIHYHLDDRGQVWMNLDYTARYPGGPFLSNEVLGILTLN